MKAVPLYHLAVLVAALSSPAVRCAQTNSPSHNIRQGSQKSSTALKEPQPTKRQTSANVPTTSPYPTAAHPIGQSSVFRTNPTTESGTTSSFDRWQSVSQPPDLFPPNPTKSTPTSAATKNAAPRADLGSAIGSPSPTRASRVTTAYPDEVVFPASTSSRATGKTTAATPSQWTTSTASPAVNSTTNDTISIRDIINAPKLDCRQENYKRDENGKCRENVETRGNFSDSGLLSKGNFSESSTPANFSKAPARGSSSEAPTWGSVNEVPTKKNFGEVPAKDNFAEKPATGGSLNEVSTRKSLSQVPTKANSARSRSRTTGKS